MIPDIQWIMKNRILRLRRRYDWLRGSVEKDGFRWETRGIHDPNLAYNGHEDYLNNELLTGGELFVDVGAHAGRWTVRASRLFKKVVAFEPTIRTANVLEKNLQLNNITNVTIENVALGDSEEWGTMYYFPRSRSDGCNSLFKHHPLIKRENESRFNQASRFVNKTDIRRLDSYNLSPTVLKIDTEGYELHVLKGAVETLKRTQKIVVEIHPPEHLQPAISILRQEGFTTRVQMEVTPHLIGDRLNC